MRGTVGRLLGSSLISLAVTYGGRVIDHYGDEALDYLDLLGIANDYGATLILEREDRAVIVREVLGFGIIIVARPEALGLGLLSIDKIAAELGRGDDGAFEVVLI